MDWNKKIVISILLVLFLASCSSRRNYGSVYFSGGDALDNASIKEDLSVEDYMSLSDSATYFVESNDRYVNEDSNVKPKGLKLGVDPMDSMQPVTKVSVDSVPDSMAKRKLIERDGVKDSIENSMIPNEDLIEYSRDSVDHSDEEMNDEIILSQEEQIRMLNERNDSINRLKLEDIDSNSNVLKSQKVDTTKILTPKDEIVQLNNRNHRLHYAATRTNNSRKDTSIVINAEDSIINSDSFNSSMVDTTEVFIENDNQTGNLLSDSLEKISDSIAKGELKINRSNSQYDAMDKVVEDSNANISESDTLFYAVFFDSTIVELNENNKETLDALVEEAKKSNYTLQLSSRVDKSDTTEADIALINQRSVLVKDYLIAQGLDKQKIISLSQNMNFSSPNIELKQGVVHCRLILKD